MRRISASIQAFHLAHQLVGLAAGARDGLADHHVHHAGAL
jgi:hypothetical protein